MLRVRDAAHQLGISPDWLKSLEACGKLPQPARDCNGHRRYTAEHLAAIRPLILPPPPTN